MESQGRGDVPLFRTAVQEGAADPVGAPHVDAAFGQGANRRGSEG